MEVSGEGNWKLETREAWGTWLQGLAKWDWFATFTFSELVSPAAAHYWFSRYLNRAEDALNGWCFESPKRSNGWGYVEIQRHLPRTKILAFRGDEYGPRQGRLHMHALIANVEGLRRYCDQKLAPGKWGKACCFVHAWPCGYARILPYDPQLGARYYVTKYVVKAFGDWQLYGFSNAATVAASGTPANSKPEGS